MRRLRLSNVAPLLGPARQPCRAGFLSRPGQGHMAGASQTLSRNGQRRSIMDETFDRRNKNPFSPRRFLQYIDPSEEVPVVRNPLNYMDKGRQKYVLRIQTKKRIVLAVSALVVGGLFQLWFWSITQDPAASKQTKGNSRPPNSRVERLDAAPNSPISEADAARGVKIVQKPGNPDIKIDDQGLELVDTGTSSIPHFPRFIKIGSASAEPSAVPTSDVPGQSVQEGLEEYSLIGYGIRTVSFLGVQVYVLGLYVRTTDLDKLQAAFVKHVNPLGSSLIPSEKETLKTTLMGNETNLDIWDKVLREIPIRSAVRIVPTRGTDFGHLRDGWVRGITSRTQQLAKQGSNEYDDESFGTAMQDFKALLGGKGKAPKGSTLILTRDERGAMSIMYEPEKKDEQGQFVVQRTLSQVLGSLADERISRQVWLGYLGGKNVSSEGAKKSIVDGVMELVARPVGTVGTQIV